jgi:hypothetical protein
MTHTEEMIECKVEKMIDRIDRQYMNGEFSDSAYHEEIRKVDAWAEAEYAKLASVSAD